MGNNTKALAAAVLTTVIWSGCYIVNKLAFAEGISPLTLMGIRYTFAGLILATVMRKPGTGKKMPVRYAVIQSVIAYLIGQGLQSIAQKMLVPTVSALVGNASTIIIITVADYFILKEHPKSGTFVKLLLMVSGMLLYYQPWTETGGQIGIGGAILMTLASVALAANTYMNRYMLKHEGVEHVSLTVYPMLFGGVMLLITGLLTGGVPAFTWKLFFCVLYLTLAGSALAFALWVWSQQTLSAPQSAAINSGVIIEIAFLDMLVFNRKLNLMNWLGIVCVFAGIVWLQLSGTRTTMKKG